MCGRKRTQLAVLVSVDGENAVSSQTASSEIRLFLWFLYRMLPNSNVATVCWRKNNNMQNLNGSKCRLPAKGTDVVVEYQLDLLSFCSNVMLHPNWYNGTKK